MTKGILTILELQDLVDHNDIDTVIVGMVDHYGRLLGKRADADFFLEKVAHHGTHVCDYLLTTDMEMEPVEGYTTANWEKGYGDYHLVPDLSTLRVASWIKKTAIVLCDMHSREGTPREVSPRQILRRQLDRLANMGYGCTAAHELEYYLMQQSYRSAAEQSYHDLRPSGWYLEDYHILQGTRMEKYTRKVRKHLKRSGIPVETSKGEWGLGQHEINIKYAPALEMADRHILYKQCTKEIADRMGLSVTYMAKYHEDQAGSSCHIHINLTSDKNNAFAGDEEILGVKCSPVFQHFLAGCIAYLPDVMPWLAPTINSYKRYAAGSWAPTSLAWDYDNRTAGFRVVGADETLRIECRIPGADCHPYLVLAALIGAGVRGLEQQLPLPARHRGDHYKTAQLTSLPQSLASATERMDTTSWVRDVYGEEVIDHYCHHYRAEVAAYGRAVTDWERRRYFERI